MHDLIQATIALLAIANPLGAVPLFLSLTKSLTSRERYGILLRFMGLILVAMGAQFLLSGVHTFFS